MKKIVKYVGLDVHKDSITIAIADEGRDGNVRLYGKIRNDLEQIDKVMRKLMKMSCSGLWMLIMFRSQTIWVKMTSV